MVGVVVRINLKKEKILKIKELYIQIFCNGFFKDAYLNKAILRVI